ncbi:MAG: UDP-2,3-diacylglucosamine diphosphatase LpxI [Rickettsiaceae bacterium]|nr:UDP-2,3-diacylglucosamine diphosphatase LpxI [Rickettsiaceae bacterium]
MTLPILGIIAGNGDLPEQVVNSYIKQGGTCYIVWLVDRHIEGVTQQKFKFGEVSKIVNYFKEHKVENVTLIGGIERPDFTSIKIDLMGSLLMAQIMKNKLKGDDNVLKIIANFIEKKGFKVVSANDILRSQNESFKSIVQPSKQDIEDIMLGRTILNILGEFDVGQSIIIDNGYVLGIEAAEGTDQLISRCSTLKKSPKSGVLIKICKPNQDRRIDQPVIGPETIKNIVKHNYLGIAIEQFGVLIINKQETLSMIDEYKLFLYYL